MVEPFSDSLPSMLLGAGILLAGTTILAFVALARYVRRTACSLREWGGRAGGRYPRIVEGVTDRIGALRRRAGRPPANRGQVLPESLPLLLFIAGIVITAAEAIIPGAHFIVIGVALTIAGLLGLLIAPLATPLALAATTLLFGAIAFYVYREFDFYEGQDTGSPKGSDDLKGMYGEVTERVTASGGEVKLRGGGFNPYYRARSLDEEIPEGTEVIVIDPGGGNVVTVTPVGDLEDEIDQELAAERESRERETETDP